MKVPYQVWRQSVSRTWYAKIPRLRCSRRRRIAGEVGTRVRDPRPDRLAGNLGYRSTSIRGRATSME